MFFMLTARRKEARFTLLKQEGNGLVKKGQFQEALEKYNECLTIKSEECALYTNRYGGHNVSKRLSIEKHSYCLFFTYNIWASYNK